MQQKFEYSAYEGSHRRIRQNVKPPVSKVVELRQNIHASAKRPPKVTLRMLFTTRAGMSATTSTEASESS
jgi:hypothetical protein